MATAPNTGHGFIDRIRQSILNAVGFVLFWVVGGVIVFAQGNVEPEQTADKKPDPKVAEKLNVKRTVILGKGEAHGLHLDEQPGSQTITVEFTSSDGVISVYIFKSADVDGDEGLLESDPRKALAAATAKSGKITVDVPEKIASSVVVRGATGKTTVEVKLTNQFAQNGKGDPIKKLEEENAALKKELAEMERRVIDLKRLLEKQKP